MALRIRCPSCRKTFICKSDSALPDECPNVDCESRIWNKLGQNREDDDIVMPFVRSSAKTKVIDKVYDDMARGSEIRAEAAASMTGASVADMSSLKITDLNPTTRPGDIAAKKVVNEVTQHMDMMQARGMPVGFGAGANGAEYGGAVQTGPHPNAGAHMRSALQIHHGNLTAGAGVSERPAIETLQPGYRVRG